MPEIDDLNVLKFSCKLMQESELITSRNKAIAAQQPQMNSNSSLTHSNSELNSLCPHSKGSQKSKLIRVYYFVLIKLFACQN